MDWQDLLEHRRVQKHDATKQELDGVRELIKRDLLDAQLPALSPDRRFATAYNAALQLCKMTIACAGYRVTTGLGHHQITFEAAQFAVGQESASLSDYFETCRRKRNALDYDCAHVVSEAQAKELVQKTKEFQHLIEKWITRNHPQLAR